MTAVEWLIEQLEINNYISENSHWLIDDAKEMEKQQVIDAYSEGDINGIMGNRKMAEQYYNETFNK